MELRFNPPPNWPPPPSGWTPPQGWQPDPAWGPPPAGWQLWVKPNPHPWLYALLGCLPLAAGDLVTRLIGNDDLSYALGYTTASVGLSTLAAGLIARFTHHRWAWWTFLLVGSSAYLALAFLQSAGRS